MTATPIISVVSRFLLWVLTPAVGLLFLGLSGLVSWPNVGRWLLLLAFLVLVAITLMFTPVRVTTGDPPEQKRMTITQWLNTERLYVLDEDRVVRTPLQHHWYVPLAAVLTVASVAIASAAITQAADLDFTEDVWPWVLLGLAVLLAVGALAAFSYAPPGPNLLQRLSALVQRLSDFDGPALLVVTGIALTVVGASGLFDFGTTSADTPSGWWSVMVGAGVLTTFIGVAKSSKHKDK